MPLLGSIRGLFASFYTCHRVLNFILADCQMPTEKRETVLAFTKPRTEAGPWCAWALHGGIVQLLLRLSLFPLLARGPGGFLLLLPTTAHFALVGGCHFDVSCASLLENFTQKEMRMASGLLCLLSVLQSLGVAQQRPIAFLVATRFAALSVADVSHQVCQIY